MQIKSFSHEAYELRGKMVEMQQVVESCSSQLLDFDNINKLSSQLIEQLQTEVELYKVQLFGPNYSLDSMKNG